MSSSIIKPRGTGRTVIAVKPSCDDGQIALSTSTDAIGNLAYMEISEVALMALGQTLYNVSINLETIMSFSPFLIVEQTCDIALQWANQQLQHAGLRTMQTFDLSAARAGAQNCLCPYHGTKQCDCQMVILLVYGSNDGPETLILHGNEGKTWLSLAHTMQPVSRLAIQIQQVLEFKEASS